ncbi:MAG: SPOR domain-containing protein [Gracilimonas sp.]|uniref:SPOR domain-containing protein n=1 Tax=Gracilimonas sp. TaxID=1974203 RepID=UPI001B1CEDAD|nr:SPOR domain-containing protein [Gracilimonas sp.]MBO6585167.1 SPOR domain-containing protein [Gracilimonas sp.]MBO6615561.1 SPOR domain-containing protein [Gracilimonas sp.]
MKKVSIYTLLLAVALVSFQACGPSEEERRAKEQARLDSLRQVQEQRIAEMMQAREDSIAQAKQQQEMVEEQQGPQFAEDGTYVVQVGAFRSEEEANEYKNTLTDRDYPHVYTVKIGKEETGDVWFRLRVGFFAEKAEAEEFGAELGSELNTGYWVSKVQRSGS